MKIFAVNNEYNGITAGIKFDKGVAFCDDDNLVSWFINAGMTRPTWPVAPTTATFRPLIMVSLVVDAHTGGALVSRSIVGRGLRSAASPAVDHGFRFGRVEAEGRVHGLDRTIEVVELRDDGDADFGDGDHVDVDARRRQIGRASCRERV